MQNGITRVAILPIGPSIAYIPLTKGMFALIDRDDADWISQWKWRAHSRYKLLFYAVRSSHGGKYCIQLHRTILGITDSGIWVDHKNCMTLDCRRSNLRIASQSENARNRRINRASTSGFKGVTRVKGNAPKWQAQIGINRRKYYLGTYSTPEVAHAAYCMAAREYHGEFARLA